MEEDLAELLTLRKKIGFDGATEYLNSDGKLHRTHGPASVTIRGSKFWYRNGELHREGGPAIEWFNGDKEWWLNGTRSRSEIRQFYED